MNGFQLAFRNARKHQEDIRAKVKKLLQINQATGSSSKSRYGKGSSAPAVTPSGSFRLEDADVMAKELDDVISMYLRKTVDHHNLRRNYEVGLC